MAQYIKFTPTQKIVEKYYPEPASKHIPNWYKTLESYIGGERKPNGNGVTSATIKKCMPVFDAISAGYLILLPADIYVSIKDGSPYYEWANHNLINFHPIMQAPNHPQANGLAYPKFTNLWGIETPKGYSTLFVQPFHRESPFTILPGIVDTDKYTSPVNFPFVMNNPSFEGLIEAGTPIAQVIPFKRDGWKMKLGGKKDIEKIASVDSQLKSGFFDRYKRFFRSNKEYK